MSGTVILPRAIFVRVQELLQTMSKEVPYAFDHLATDVYEQVQPTAPIQAEKLHAEISDLDDRYPDRRKLAEELLRELDWARHKS